MAIQDFSNSTELFQSFHKDIDSYNNFYQYSITHPEQFWSHLYDYLEIKGETVDIDPDQFPAKILADKTINVAQNILRHQSEETAFSFYYNDQSKAISYQELNHHVIQFRAFLLDYDVCAKDKVFAITSNHYEAVVAMLATISIGAIWSYTDIYTDQTIIANRCQHINPKILITANNIYNHDGLIYSNDIIVDLIKDLSNLKKIVVLDHDHDDTRIDMADSIAFRSIIASYPIDHPEYRLFDFYHPACITFDSSEQPITISAGHLLLESLKDIVFQKEIKQNDQLLIASNHSNALWYTLITSLYLETSIHLHDCLSDININHILSQKEIKVLGIYDRDIAKLELPISEEKYPYLNKVITVGNQLTQLDINLFSDSKPLAIINTLTRPGFLTTFLWTDQQQQIETFCYKGLGLEFRVGHQQLLMTNENPTSAIAFPALSNLITSSYYTQQDEFYLDCLVEENEEGILFKGRYQTALTLDNQLVGTLNLYHHLKGIDFIKRSIATCRKTSEQNKLILLVELNQAIPADRSAPIEIIKETIRDTAGLKFVPQRILFTPSLPHINYEMLELQLQQLVNQVDDFNQIDETTISNTLLMS